MGSRVHTPRATGDYCHTCTAKQSAEALGLLAAVITAFSAAHDRERVQIAWFKRSFDIQHQRRIGDCAKQHRILMIIRADDVRGSGGGAIEFGVNTAGSVAQGCGDCSRFHTANAFGLPE